MTDFDPIAICQEGAKRNRRIAQIGLLFVALNVAMASGFVIAALTADSMRSAGIFTAVAIIQTSITLLQQESRRKAVCRAQEWEAEVKRLQFKAMCSPRRLRLVR